MFFMVLIYVIPSPILNTVITLTISHHISYDICGVRTSIGSVLLTVSL